MEINKLKSIKIKMEIKIQKSNFQENLIKKMRELKNLKNNY